VFLFFFPLPRGGCFFRSLLITLFGFWCCVAHDTPTHLLPHKAYIASPSGTPLPLKNPNPANHYCFSQRDFPFFLKVPTVTRYFHAQSRNRLYHRMCLAGRFPLALSITSIAVHFFSDGLWVLGSRGGFPFSPFWFFPTLVT